MLKKRFDHMTREEYRRKKKGADYSDEYDDEEDNDSYWEDSDYDSSKADRTAGKVIPGNESQETELGKKGDKLVRPPGISDKEWRKMNREQQMERMNKMAHGFNFYAMDKENENLKYKMPF